MATEENPHAGTGSVVLDIGGDIGALVVVMPADMDGLEVEIIPSGTDARPPNAVTPGGAGVHAHPHEHSHSSDHSHSDDHAHPPGDNQPHSHPHPGEITPSPPHVAVVGRPTPSGSIVHSLVFDALPKGTYDLYVRPFGPVHLNATVIGGQVTEASW